jgi:Outer membrane protein beta-barrel domain
MKKFLLTAAMAIGCIVSANAQFGIKAGLNFANLKGDGAENFNVLTNFHIGGLYEARVFEHVYLQPELLYAVQGARVDNDEIKLNYFTVPVLLKIYLNGNFNLQAGPQMSMLISESDNFKPFKSETFDFGWTGGLEFFVTDGFFIQARYYGGTKEISGNTDLKNTMVSASIGFVF